MDIGIVGLGLIGASLAKAFEKIKDVNIFGLDKSDTVTNKAVKNKVINGILDDKAIGQCDILITALYPKDTVDYIKSHYDCLKPTAVIIDTCGVKRYVCNEIFPLAKRKGFTFIGGHPMAGLEFSGYDHSTGDLFKGASMILVPDPNHKNCNNLIYGCRPGESPHLLTDIFIMSGFEQIITATPDEHDIMIAYTSQLAHIVSGAYVKNPVALSHKGFSAGSFHDMTRVAKLNAEMWTELFLDNKDNLTSDIDILIQELTKFKKAMDKNDREELFSLLKEGCLIREDLLRNNGQQ